MSVLLILALVLISIVTICNTCVFPLSSGSPEPGTIAVRELREQSKRRVIRNYPLVAAIVEPRTDNLIKIISHYLKVLPMDTHFQVYHGTDNLDILWDNFSPLITTGKISLWNMGVKNLNVQSYSYLLTSKEFWHTIQGERVLIFQTDSITCPNSKVKISDFYGYDFVGAPTTWYIDLLIAIFFLGKGYVTGHTRFYNVDSVIEPRASR